MVINRLNHLIVFSEIVYSATLLSGQWKNDGSRQHTKPCTCKCRLSPPLPTLHTAAPATPTACLQCGWRWSKIPRTSSNLEPQKTLKTCPRSSLQAGAKWHVRIDKQSCKQANRLILWGVGGAPQKKKFSIFYLKNFKNMI